MMDVPGRATTAAQQLRRVLPPQVADALRTARDGLSPQRRRARLAAVVAGDDGLARAVSPSGIVLAGPFAGLHLPAMVTWGGAPARLAGTYESEIVPLLEECLAARPARVVDVGCAEGYYAVGIARRLPATEILAYDLDPQARREARETVRLNAVHNVRVRGRITPRMLERALEPETFLLVDCEGYERVLLDPAAVPSLPRTDMLVELHEFADPGLTEHVLARFTDTHDITVVDASPRRGRYPQLRHLDPATAHRAVQEGRPDVPHPQQWARLKPRPGR